MFNKRNANCTFIVTWHDELERVEVHAILTTTGRENALLERIVGRLSLEASVGGVSWVILGEHK